jgi:hypothetical protein
MQKLFTGKNWSGLQREWLKKIAANHYPRDHTHPDSSIHWKESLLR